MAAFRRCILALAVLAVFAGLASAQMNCNPNTTNGNAYIRSEGKSELVGDLLLFCTGGTPTQGAQAPQVNITITLPQAITSKVLGSAVSGYTPTEALLVMDDGVITTAGGTTTTTQTFCATTPTVAAGVCPVFEQANTSGGFVPSGVAGNFTGATPVNNVFQGWVNLTSTPNQVTFFGVPVVPPGTAGQRSFRMVNVRENVSAGASGTIVAQVGAVNTSGSGQQQITLTAVTQVLGNVQPSLKITASPLATANCNALNWAFAGTVSFSQQSGFTNAFKTRQQASTVPTTGSTFSGTPTNNQANAVNAAGTTSESGYAMTVSGNQAGLADYGTRLKAIFNNIPSGASVFVSFTNVTLASVFSPPSIGAPSVTYNTANVGSSAATAGLAELLLSGAETLPDQGTGPLLSMASTLTVPQTFTATSPGVKDVANFPFVQLTVAGGTATAVWEVLDAFSTSSFTFDVFITLPAQGATGTATVNLSYAPTVTTLTVPQFVDPNAATPQNSIVISQCRTILLYPYVTSAAGFDTGIAVANTSTDVLGTTAQNNSCAVTLYGGAAPVPTLPAAVWNVAGQTGLQSVIPSGQVGAFSLMGAGVSGFTGYAIAVCNFQFAHGFAFVADWTSTIQSSAMGYLALILPSSGPRLPANFANVETLTQ